MKIFNFKKDRKIFLALLILLVSISLISCSKPDMEGIVIRTEEKYVQIATKLSIDEYREIKDLSKIQEEDVFGDTNRGLIDLTYDNPEEFNQGDQVEVWIDGNIRESYPGRANAKKIKHKEQFLPKNYLF